jgi:hypothetical protein
MSMTQVFLLIITAVRGKEFYTSLFRSLQCSADSSHIESQIRSPSETGVSAAHSNSRLRHNPVATAVSKGSIHGQIRRRILVLQSGQPFAPEWPACLIPR